jgi:hypothetical protein
MRRMIRENPLDAWRRWKVVLLFAFIIGWWQLNITEAHGATFSNTGAITIPDSGAATPYPSEITVSGVTGTVTKVTVSIYDLNHTWADDIDMLLVGPGGQTVMLMSDQGYDDAISLNLTFIRTGRGACISWMTQLMIQVLSRADGN